MNHERVDLTSFSNAVNSLNRALNEYAKDESNDYVRDACIQRFEYCFDASRKIIKRYFKSIMDDPMELENTSFADLIREAYTKGLVKHSWDEWDKYRLNRNATSHSYHEGTAIEIVESLPLFLQELLFLLNSLQSKNET